MDFGAFKIEKLYREIATSGFALLAMTEVVGGLLRLSDKAIK